MLVVGIIIFLLLSAFFSASEIAYVSSNKLGIEVLKEKGTRRARLISSFYEKPKKFLGTTLVGNNIALVVFTALMTKFLSPLFGDLNPDSALVLIGNTLLITIVVLILGEFLPKTFSRVYSIGFLHIAAYPLRFFQWLLTFPTWSMTLLSGMIIKYIFKGPIDKADPNLSMVDLQHYLEEISEGDENIDKEILTNAMNLGQLKVRDCMIPRNEISYIDLNSTIPELIEEFKSSNHSRVIVADGDVENVVGYIHHQQLISNPKNLKKLVLMLPYVPEAMNILLLLNKFIANKTSMACVVDEFGGTAGLITLEDILEEIFGEIEDEHDTEEFEYTQLSENEFRFSGRVELDMINEKFENLNIPEGEYHTLSGYVVMTSGSIPDQNSEITIDGMRLIFEKVSDKRIAQIKLPEPKSENA
jgi:CBS domain containing-hemolysin-like protein